MKIQMNFNNAMSNTMEHMINFHDHSMILIITNTILISYWLTIQKMSIFKMNAYENNSTEMFWTSIPLAMIFFISLPSMLILYMLEESKSPSLTMKIISSQWFWSYFFLNNMKLDMNSNMQNSFTMRLLKTNNIPLIPNKTWIRIVTTSNDVIHSWALPALAIKMDTFPGRLNTNNMMTNRSAIIVGQCSEICGANHSFMPIFMKSMNKKITFKNK